MRVALLRQLADRGKLDGFRGCAPGTFDSLRGCGPSSISGIKVCDPSHFQPSSSECNAKFSKVPPLLYTTLINLTSPLNGYRLYRNTIPPKGGVFIEEMPLYLLFAITAAASTINPGAAAYTLHIDRERPVLAIQAEAKTPVIEASLMRAEHEGTTTLPGVSGNAPSLSFTPKTRKAWVTAYSSSPDETDDTPFTTASGKQVRHGIVASNFVPLGTKIRIPEIFGDETFTVEDRMHARKTNGVDIWMPTKEQAKRFGVSYAEIVILD